MVNNSIENLTDGQAIDQILIHAINVGDFISIVEIQKNVITGITEERVKHLFKLLNNLSPKVAITYMTKDLIGFEVLDEANNFINKGGFSAIESKENEEREWRMKEVDIQMKLANSNIEANERQKRVQKRQDVFSVILIIVGIVNLAVFIYQVIVKE